MSPDEVRQLLDSSDQAGSWLTFLGLKQIERGHRSLLSMAELGITLDLLGVMATQLQDFFSRKNPYPFTEAPRKGVS